MQLLMALLAFQVVCLFLWGLMWPRQAPVELSFVVRQDELPAWEILIAGFESSHPGIRVHPVTDPEKIFTTDQREAIYTADFQADNAQYDLVYMDIVWMPQFTDQLLDLMPRVKQDQVDLSKFLQSELMVGTEGDALYRIPMRADLGLLYYRRDLLEQAGLEFPSTVTDLATTVAAIKQSTGIDFGYLWQGRSYEGLVANFVEVMSGLGATWIDPITGKVGLNTPEAIEAAKLLKQLLQQDISPPIVTDHTGLSSLGDFKQGRSIFLRGWPSFWPELRQSGWDDRVAIALPFSFNNTPGFGCRGGWGFGIPQNAAHPDEAWEVIKYFTSAAAQKQFVLASGTLPSRRSLFTDPTIVAQHPQMPQMLDYLENSSVFRPAIEQYDEASSILQTALGKILRGQQSVVEAMNAAQRETEELLKG